MKAVIDFRGKVMVDLKDLDLVDKFTPVDVFYGNEAKVDTDRDISIIVIKDTKVKLPESEEEAE